MVSDTPQAPSERGQDSTLALAHTAMVPSHDLSGAPTLGAHAGAGRTKTAEQARSSETLATWSSALEALGRYVVLGTLGKGGMGTVLKAFDRSLDRPVALKVLHEELDEEHTLRLRREAQAMAKLSHPNVVQVYEVAEVDGQTFVAMELVEGKSLRAWMRRSPAPGWRECVEVFIGAGAGLAAAHERGLVHRDFKPDNAVIDDKGRPRVLDFGLARQAEADDEPGQRQTPARPEDENEDENEAVSEVELNDSALRTPLTRAGMIVGTPGYMPLEQIEGAQTDARTDQFSFCVALFEALYGARPFAGSTITAQVVSMVAGEVKPAPKGTKVPAPLRKVLLRGLAADAADRWPSMDALLVELRRVSAPSRRGWLALGVFGGLGLLSLSIAYRAGAGERCEGAADKLEGIWDDARIQQVEAAILGTGLAYAPDTWTRVEQRLNDYAAAWAEKHTEVCEATSVRQEQSAEVMGVRMECLRRRRVALREAVAVLADADNARVQRAVSLAAGLPRLSRCDDVEALRAELPPPEDPQIAAQVEAQQEMLQRAASLEAAGDYDAASQVTADVLVQAESLAYTPLLAQGLFRRGSLRDKAGDYTDSVADLEEALRLAGEHGDDAVTTMSMAQLTRVVGGQQGHNKQGLVWGKAALAAATAPGVEPLTEAFVLNNMGIVRNAQGKYDEALAHYRHALTIREESLDPNHPTVAGLLSNIGIVLLSTGKHDEALDHHRRALAIQEQALGPTHPDVGMSLNSIGNVFQGQGKYEEALAELRHAQSIFEGLGSTHPHVARPLHNIAQVLMRQGKFEESRAHFERAMAIMVEAQGPKHPDVATTLNSIGMVLGSEAKYAEALTYFQRALAIKEEVLGPTHPGLAYTLNNIGTVYGNQGEYTRALEHHRRALAINEESLGATHSQVGRARFSIGKVLQGQGDIAAAAIEFEQSLAILKDALGADHPIAVYPMVGLAHIALDKGEPDAARAHAERAVSIRESSGGSASELADTRLLLARSLWPDPAQRTRAHALALQAREGYEGVQGHEKGLAAIDTWLAKHPAP